MRDKIWRFADAYAASYLVSRGYCASLPDAQAFMDRLYTVKGVRAWWRLIRGLA